MIIILAEELASGIGETYPDYALLQDLFNDYDLPSGSVFEESDDETTGMIPDSAELSLRLSDSDSELSLINTEPDVYFHRFQQRQDIVMLSNVEQELAKCKEHR